MRIIIIGAGKVGYALAADLCAEGHDVTVIDNQRSRLDVLEEHLNVSAIHGNAARTEILAQARVADADLFIAVTEKDELNMVASFIAKSAGAAATIARVRNPVYSDFDDEARRSALGVDMFINPERVSAAEIAKLIAFPEANYVGYFGGGQAQVLEVTIEPDCPWVNKPLAEVHFPSACIVVAVSRGTELIIPKGFDHLEVGDEILLLGNTGDMRELENFLSVEVLRPRDVVIYGGGITGYYLASMLEQSKRRPRVRLLEADLERCEELASQLPLTAILHRSGSDMALFSEEGVGAADIFVAVDDDDKDNLFAALLARNLGVGKTIVQIRGGDYAHAVETMGVDKTISPSRLAADAILGFINRRRVLSLTRFEDTEGQLIEFKIPEQAPAVGKQLLAMDFPLGAIVCMLIRGSHHIIPQGRDTVEAGDTAIVFSLPQVVAEVAALLTGKDS